LQKAGWTTKKGQFGAVRFMIGGEISYYNDLKKVFNIHDTQIDESLILNNFEKSVYNNYMKITIPSYNSVNLQQNQTNIENLQQNQKNIEFIKFNAKVLKIIMEQYGGEGSNQFNNLTGTYLFLGIYTIFRLNKETVNFLYTESKKNTNKQKLDKLYSAYHEKFEHTTVEEVNGNSTLKNAATRQVKEKVKEKLQSESDVQLENIILSIVEITCSVILPAVPIAISGLKRLVRTAYNHIFSKKISMDEQYKKLIITFQSIGIITGYYSKYTTKLKLFQHKESEESYAGGMFRGLRSRINLTKKVPISNDFNLFINLFKIIYDKIPKPKGEDKKSFVLSDEGDEALA
jgi:hypothetical protein